MDVRIVGNFDVGMRTLDPKFSKKGWWYSFFEGDSILVTDLYTPLNLAPGAYRVYTSKRLNTPDITTSSREIKAETSPFHVYPNPVSGMLHMEAVPETSKLSIINLAGQTVRSIELNSYQDQVDLSFLSSGLYLLSRQVGNEAPAYVKVIRE